MKTTFVSGRHNLALTVMVPFDCPNNCPFCESKKEYATNRPNLNKVLNTMELFFKKNNTLEVPEVVITGGEPMADIRALYAIINTIPSDKDIYINTTLIKRNFDAFVDLVNNHPQIKGINVSRHCTTYEEDRKTLHGIVTDNEISRIKKSVRINCVIKDRKHSFFRGVIARWERTDVELSFREDFNEMTEEALHNPYSHSLPYVATVKEYLDHTFCKVCDTTVFCSSRGLIIRYHKGLKNTFINLGKNKYEINDIIIRQDGSIFCDWDFTNAHILPPELLYDDMKDIMKRSRERMIEIASTPAYTCGGGWSSCGGGYRVRTCGGGYEYVDNPPCHSCGGGSAGGC